MSNGSSRPPYAGTAPGTQEWMYVWREYPHLQEEMLAYSELLKIGINPIDPTEGFRVSNSALEATSCSVKALLRYGYKVTNPEEGFAMGVGSAVHIALAHYFRTGEAEESYQRFKKAYPTGPAPEARLDYDNVRVIIRHYLESVLQTFPYYVHPSLVELWFEQVLHPGDEQDPEPIILVGRIDLLPEDPQGKALMVLDHKTTGKITEWYLKRFRMSSALNGYQWAAQKFMPSKLFPGNIINAIELPKLPQPGKKCKTHGVDYMECRKWHPNHQIFSIGSEPHMIEEWRKTAIFQAKRLRALVRDYGRAPEGVKYVRMTGKFNGGCVFCPYVDFCLADRPIEWIGTILKKKEDLEKIDD